MDALGRGLGNFAQKEANNFGTGGVPGVILGSKGSDTAYSGVKDVTKGAGGLLGGGGNLLAGLGKGASSPVMWIALAGIAGVILIVMLKPRPTPAPVYMPPAPLPR